MVRVSAHTNTVSCSHVAGWCACHDRLASLRLACWRPSRSLALSGEELHDRRLQLTALIASPAAKSRSWAATAPRLAAYDGLRGCLRTSPLLLLLLVQDLPAILQLVSKGPLSPSLPACVAHPRCVHCTGAINVSGSITARYSLTDSGAAPRFPLRAASSMLIDPTFRVQRKRTVTWMRTRSRAVPSLTCTSERKCFSIFLLAVLRTPNPVHTADAVSGVIPKEHRQARPA